MAATVPKEVNILRFRTPACSVVWVTAVITEVPAHCGGAVNGQRRARGQSYLSGQSAFARKEKPVSALMLRCVVTEVVFLPPHRPGLEVMTSMYAWAPDHFVADPTLIISWLIPP